MIEKTYNVGIYCRLSNDDERDGESVSIENQTGTQVRISTGPALNASSKMQKPRESTSFW